ncbi:hypothetical protein JQ634_00355 [Bradyrhizobium sp. AUGA SZCCT0240]|uniref:hypothetical protein n=1 Tax=unclassified Bradyrhizobium TaxID=2631580 RepID=UPI001BABA8C1|nr:MULTISPECIES: hypothetical protein [unclassified Bradyrhizobium]MBR1195992.1 hypothetical protein [Bradyrhizobium sp. AUGA SZCCT0158]MBR1240829.1 hypothetical protein [Bradyrhizobium sp. AUGA SZCCT0274]MBR1252147.1 hypothetical protein [Bradyrhizobium sp. AUGA SZCCT0240]
MRNVITMAGVALAAALAAPASHAAESNFDGLWAKTAKDCRNKEGPDSKTLIDMSKPIGGKPAPMVDQYENHCRIDRKTVVGDGINLSVTCFEFWDYFNKGVEPRKATVKLAPGPNGTIKIDGKPYLRCKAGSGR